MGEVFADDLEIDPKGLINVVEVVGTHVGKSGKIFKISRRIPGCRRDDFGSKNPVDPCRVSEKNFFLYQPYLFSFNTGLQTTLLKNLFIDFGTIIDFRSLLKYGYAPMTIQSFWFSDLTGNGAKLNQGVLTKDQLQALYITSVSQVASYYTSLPNLLSGTVTMPLAPNVLIGNFALLDPWKTGTPYNGSQGAIFYITGVSHRWRMGGKSQTSLQIERGLPAHVYLDDNALKEFLEKRCLETGMSFLSIRLHWDFTPTCRYRREMLRPAS